MNSLYGFISPNVSTWYTSSSVGVNKMCIRDSNTIHFQLLQPLRGNGKHEFSLSFLYTSKYWNKSKLVDIVLFCVVFLILTACLCCVGWFDVLCITMSVVVLSLIHISPKKTKSG